MNPATRSLILFLGIAFALPALALDPGEIPLAFEADRGQLAGDTRFLGRAAGLELAVSEHGVSACGPRPGCVRLSFAPGQAARAVRGERRLPGLTHYFVGADPSGWLRDVPTYGAVRLEQVYPGVDAVFYGAGALFEFDFEVAAGADPGPLAVEFGGARGLRVDGEGRLAVALGDDELILAAPFAYQDGPTGRSEVASAWRVIDATRAGFELAPHDGSRALVIDPVILGYSTSLGGSAAEFVNDLVVDVDGNVYVVGETRSDDFSGSGTVARDADAFVVKLSPDGRSIVYTTLLGGGAYDTALGLAVDAGGQAYLSGQTESADFPTPDGADTTLGTTGVDPDSDAFVARLDASGVLEYGTYFGGAELDGRFQGGIALSPSGVAYITSRVRSPGLATPGAYQDVCTDECAFVAGFDTTLTGPASRVYTSYVNGNLNEGGLRIGTDDAGSVYVVGFTGSDTGLVTAGQGFQSSTGDVNDRDHFLVKIDPAVSGPSALQYSTYIGGLGDSFEEAGLVVAGDGRVWVTGETESNSISDGFPSTAGSHQPLHGGNTDAYVMSIDTTQVGPASLLWSTYLGGTAGDGASGLSLDPDGNVWVAMTVGSTDFPLVGPLPQFPAPTGGAGGSTGVVARLTPDGSQLQLSTPVARAHRVAAGGAGVWVAGSTNDPAFPKVDAIPQSQIGLTEIFLARLDPDAGLRLDVTDTLDPAPLSRYTAIQYLITNQSAQAFDSVTLDASIPPAVDLEIAPECEFQGGRYLCSLLHPLEPGESAPLYFRVRSSVDTTVDVDALVAGTPVDLDPSDNADALSFDIGAAAGLPAASLKLADFDAVALKWDIGGFVQDTRSGVLGTPNGSLEEAASFMRFEGEIPLHVVELLGRGVVAFGYVERASWTPAPFDGSDLIGADFNTFADRVFAKVFVDGSVELWSAASGSPGTLIASGQVSLDPGKAFALEIDPADARVIYDGQVVAQGNPFTGFPAAAASNVGDDQVITIASADADFPAAAVINGIGDADGDGIADPVDVCPFAPNGIAQAATPGVGNQTDASGDGIGDACQCGDTSDDGRIDIDDLTALRAYLVDPVGAPLSQPALDKCNVIAPGVPCGVAQVVPLARATLPVPLPPGIAQVCPAAIGR